MGPRVQENGTQHLGNLGGIRGNGTQIWGSLWETQPWLLVTFSYWRPSMFSGATFVFFGRAAKRDLAHTSRPDSPSIYGQYNQEENHGPSTTFSRNCLRDGPCDGADPCGYDVGVLPESRCADSAEPGDLPAPTLECVLKRESPDRGGVFCRLPLSGGAYSRRQLLANACHRSLARRLIAVCGCAVLVVPQGQRPHPRRSTADPDLKDAANHHAIGKYVVVVVPLLTGSVRN
jgi:hypothetical protein